MPEKKRVMWPFTNRPHVVDLPMLLNHRTAEARDGERNSILDTWELDSARLLAELLERRKAAAAADALVDDLASQLAAARLRRAVAEDAVRDIGGQLDRRRHRMEAHMRALTDPRLTGFLAELDVLKREASRKVQQLAGYSAPSVDGNRRRTLGYSNLPAVMAVTMAIMKARDRATELIFQRTPDLDAQLEELRQSIPTVNEAEAAIAAGPSDLQPAS